MKKNIHRIVFAFYSVSTLRNDFKKNVSHQGKQTWYLCVCPTFLCLFLVALLAVIFPFIVIFHSVEQYFIEIQRFEDVDHKLIDLFLGQFLGIFSEGGAVIFDEVVGTGRDCMR